jgi:tryptophan aminotransferase
MLHMEKAPGMISLLAGKPNSSTFPISSVTFTTTHPFGDSVDITLDGPALEQALNYNMISGIPELVEWTTGLQERAHRRGRNEGWRVSLGVGSQDLIYKVNFRMKVGVPEISKRPCSAAKLCSRMTTPSWSRPLLTREHFI